MGIFEADNLNKTSPEGRRTFQIIFRSDGKATER